MSDSVSENKLEPLQSRALSDAEILRSVELTLRDVIVPAIGNDEDWAKTASVQLIGLVRYALRRGEDRTERDHESIVAALNSMRDNVLVVEMWDRSESQASVLAATGALLARATSEDSEAALQIRTKLRPLVIQQLDDELAETSPLVGAFRGVLDDD